MIDKFFDLILSLIQLSFSSIVRKYAISNTSSIYYDTFHSQVLELSISCLIMLSIARGDTSKILSCIKTLLIECNFASSDANILLDNFNICKSSFCIEIPEILTIFKKNVCSFLLGKVNIPEWCSIGFPVKALCETFTINYHFHRRNLNKLLNNDFKSKSKCSTSFTFDGQYLILYRCNRIYMIGTGYNNTPVGVEVFSSLIDVSNMKDLPKKSDKCCTSGGWIGYMNGELFLQPHSNWSLNQIMHLDVKTFKLKNIIPVISDYSNNKMENPLKNPTLCTTDGDCMILISALKDDYFVVRELKPLKISFNSKSLLHGKEKISFSQLSEIKIRLSTVSLLFCGDSGHNLSLPSKSLVTHCYDGDSQLKNFLSVNLKIVEMNNQMEYKNIFNIITGKDFSLMLSDQGKVYYTGNAQSLGLYLLRFCF